MLNLKYTYMVIISVSLFIASTCSALDASWYSIASLKKEGTWKYSQGIMANGERFDNNQLTCACRLYRLGERLKITNSANNKSVKVTVTDRIGRRFAETRIDLSRRAFEQIADLRQGVIKIKVEVVR